MRNDQQLIDKDQAYAGLTVIADYVHEVTMKLREQSKEIGYTTVVPLGSALYYLEIIQNVAHDNMREHRNQLDQIYSEIQNGVNYV